MGSNFQKRIKITWGNSFANTLSVAYPLDDWNSTSAARQGSVFVQSLSGIEDAWIYGTDYTLSGQVRWIPTSDTDTATGWDGSTGWRAFIEWARQKQQFRFYPDKDSGTYILSYLVDPIDGAHSLEPDGTRSITLSIRNGTTAYSGY